MNKLIKQSFAAFAIAGLLFSACTQKEQYTDAIVGKWEIIDVDKYEPEPGFIWEFREDLTYSITNNVGKFETDPFKSTPFRAKGTFTGGYLVDAPKGMTIREKYRAPMLFSSMEISEDEQKMEMCFRPIEERAENESEYITIHFKRLE